MLLVKASAFDNSYVLSVRSPESEPGLCWWNDCHCFSITDLPQRPQPRLQSLWSLLELVPAEWSDWWVGGSACVFVWSWMYICVHCPGNQILHLCCISWNLIVFYGQRLGPGHVYDVPLASPKHSENFNCIRHHPCILFYVLSMRQYAQSRSCFGHL